MHTRIVALTALVLLLAAPAFAGPEAWTTVEHGGVNEGNLAWSDHGLYLVVVGAAPGLAQMRTPILFRSPDAGVTWQRTYPPVDPLTWALGVEGDVAAYGDDVIYVAVNAATSLATRRVELPNGDEAWETHPIPLAGPYNDQAWLAVAPYATIPGQLAPFTLSLFIFQGGATLMTSHDGGLTWLPRTLVLSRLPTGEMAEVPPDAPVNPLCELAVQPPGPVADNRVPNAGFAAAKSGRHGAWGTDGRFYWAQVKGGDLLLCATRDFVAWEGTRHPVGAGPDRPVYLVFDAGGTLYVLHMDRVYVSLDGGRSLAFTQSLPVWGDGPTRAPVHAAQHLASGGGALHLALARASGKYVYLRVDDAATGSPRFSCEGVDDRGGADLDFMQIVADPTGRPAMSYTVRTVPPLAGGVTTSVRMAPLSPAPGSCAAL